MSYPAKIIQMAGSARSINASFMPVTLDEKTYNADIYALNYAILLFSCNLAKIDISISQIFTQFSRSFLLNLLNTPVEDIKKIANHSLLMFRLEKSNNSMLNYFFNTASIEVRNIKSKQKLQLFLLREAARNDISTAQLISGLSVDELILLANQSNDEITKTLLDNHHIYVYRGTESALKQSLIMPESNNAQMISFTKLLLGK